MYRSKSRVSIEIIENIGPLVIGMRLVYESGNIDRFPAHRKKAKRSGSARGIFNMWNMER